jgi:predicted PurR-regulated permease PerM
MTTSSTSQSSKSTQNGAVTKTNGEDETNGASQKPGTGSDKKAGHPVAGVLTRIFRVNLAERRLLTGLLVLATLYTIYFARGLLLPIVLALLISSLLQPLVLQLNRVKIPSGIAAIIVLLLFTAALATVIHQIAAPATEWFERRPYLVSQLNYKLRNFKKSLEAAKETTDAIGKIADLGEDGTQKKDKVVVEGPSLSDAIVSRTRTAAATFLVVIVLVYFLLSRGQSTLDRMGEEMEKGGTGKMWVDILNQVQHQVARYLFTVTVINVSLGVLTSLAMWILGMPSPMLWGVVATVLNFVPYLGGIVATLIIATVSLLTFITWPKILMPPLFYILLNGVEGQFVTPMIVGRQLALNPIAVVLSLLFWGWVWGIGGMLIAVPILAAIQIVSQNIASLRNVKAIVG